MALPAKLTLERLMDGNERFVNNRSVHPRRDSARRLVLRTAQHPRAVVLACADSRVVPELIFDQGFGDLFSIRVAGNIVDDAIIGSMEYAVVHLGVKLVLVLGHESCGAVAAAIDPNQSERYIGELVDAILPAVERARALKGDLHHNTVVENARMAAEILRGEADELAQQAGETGLLVVPAFYSLRTGRVELLT